MKSCNLIGSEPWHFLSSFYFWNCLLRSIYKTPLCWFLAAQAFFKTCFWRVGRDYPGLGCQCKTIWWYCGLVRQSTTIIIWENCTVQDAFWTINNSEPLICHGGPGAGWFKLLVIKLLTITPGPGPFPTHLRVCIAAIASESGEVKGGDDPQLQRRVWGRQSFI